MAFDPHKEDYQRLGLRFARTLSEDDPQAATREFAAFSRRYALNRDSLPQSDADRAFHLVADAATLIDYQLPFATDEEAETIIARGHRLLDEALALDPECHDAARMKMSADCLSFESYYDYLRSEAPSVKESCMRRQVQNLEDNSPERARLGASLALRPYLRWLATIASKAVICGRNREALRIIDELLDLDPIDPSDARFTAALAYAKLEDEQGLEKLAHHCASRLSAADGAWMRLSFASLAYRRRDYAAAREHITRIVDTYPYAAPTLAMQRELPDGVFARLAVPPYSEDELVLAVSEATVLLQEGRDAFGRGSFGSWVMLEAVGLATKEQLADLSELVKSIAATLPNALGSTNLGLQGGDALGPQRGGGSRADNDGGLR